MAFPLSSLDLVPVFFDGNNRKQFKTYYGYIPFYMFKPASAASPAGIGEIRRSLAAQDAYQALFLL